MGREDVAIPLVGVLCEDSRHYGEPHSFDEYLDLLKRGTCKTHVPIEMVVAMSRNADERSDAGISATMILGCPRQVALAADYDYYEFPSRYWHRFRGTLGHFMLEYYDEGDPDVIREVRFKKTIEVLGKTVVLSGRPDKINVRIKLILDYKSTKEVPLKPKLSHEQQVNIYRWLLWGGARTDTGEIVHIDVERGGIQYFDMDEPLKHAVPIWPLEQTEAFIVERLTPIVRWQLTGELPPQMVDEAGRRHPLCAPIWCPLRAVCDERMEADHGQGEPYTDGFSEEDGSRQQVAA
jgi:hypothetical protein